MIKRVELGDESYDIVVERNSIDHIEDYLDLDRKVLILTDNGVPSIYSEKVRCKCKYGLVYKMENGESSKSFEVLQVLCRILLENSFSRYDCVVAVGGGVVGDLACFLASIYMRGIDFYNIPTTLLAQVDSSIGGKNSINFNFYKNMIGSFYQPKKVIIDVNTLNTLGIRQVANGMSEIIKMAICFNSELFYLLEKYNLYNINEIYDKIIDKTISIKIDIVEQDKKEKGVRRVLNFGHTMGHAIESLNFGRLYHGECVSIGMLYMSGDKIRDRVKNLLENYKLYFTDYNPNFNQILDFVKRDKKVENNAINLIFSNEIGTFTQSKMNFDEYLEYLKSVKI